MTSFDRVAFAEVISDVSAGSPKVQQASYLESGRYAVVDQGQQHVAGYTDDESMLSRVSLPILVFGDHTRRFKYVDRPFAVGADGVKLLKPAPELDTKFAYWYLSSVDLPNAGYSRHFKFLKGLTIPLPPLPEQRRIAEILDRADELRARRRRAIALLDELAQSSFISMFGQLSARFDSPWSKKLGQVASIGSGSTPDRKSPHFFGGGIPWVKTTEVHGEVIRHTDESVSVEGQKSARLRVFPAGSIVIAMYGQGKTRGQSAVLGMDATVNQACAVVRPSENFLVEFMAQQLTLLYEQLRAMAQGGNQANLNLGLVAELEVLVPPISEQQQFVELIRRVQDLRSHQIVALTKLDELFASLQQRAFSGQL